jgi:hypothetical protein
MSAHAYHCYNNPISFSRHAATRAKQRGIPRSHIAALLDFGTSKIRHGCEVIYMDKASRQRARRMLGRRTYALLEPAFDAYLVVGDDGGIVTCAHRTRKFRF